jgi:hypothetical protein
VKNSAVNIDEEAEEKKVIKTVDTLVAGGLKYQFVIWETGHVLNTNDNSWKELPIPSTIY